MNYSGNMPDWHQYNPPPPQPNINEATSSAQNVNSTHHYSFVSNINSASLNGPNVSAEGLEKHQNDTSYNARHYQPHNNITNSQNNSDNAILPSMVQMSGCIGHYGPPTGRNTMVDNLNGPVDTRSIPIGTLNEELGYRNNQLPMTGPIPHLNGPNLNISSVPAPIGSRNASAGSSGSTVRQGPPSYIPCKGLCCNPPDSNIGYQHWDKFGPYQPHTPYRDNARSTSYQTDNRRYRADFNFRKDHFDGKDTLPPVVQSVDHRRNFPDYKYRKDSVIPRSYPATSTAVQNYPVQNYNYPGEYQKYPYPMKEYPKMNGISMPNSGVLKHQEQNLVAQQKYANKSLQYQNVGYAQKGVTPNVSGTIISSTQASYYNTQFQRNVPPSEYPRECQEQTDSPAAINRLQPSAMQNPYSRYQAYQQKIMMQKISMENHLREMSRIPGYQTHPKYKESVMRYQELLKLQQSIGYQNPTQQNSQTNVSVNNSVPPINLQFDQNGTLINTSYLPEAFPRVQQVMNTDSNADALQNQRKEHALNMSKMENHDIRPPQHIINHSQSERPTAMCPEKIQSLEEFPVHKDLRQEHYKVQANDPTNYDVLRTNIGEDSAAHQKISKEFADKPQLDVRQFLANWDETEDEDPSGGNLPPAVVLTDSTPVVVVGYENVSVAAKTAGVIDTAKQKTTCNEEINVDASNKEVSVLDARDCLTISYPAAENIEISKFCAEQSGVGSVVKPGSIIHCISNGPDEIPTIHIVDNVEIGNILKVSTEATAEAFPRQDSLSLFEETTNIKGSSITAEHVVSKEKQTCDSSTEYSPSVDNANNSAANTNSSEKNNAPKVRQINQTNDASAKNTVDSTDGNLRKQNSFLSEEPHNPDDISLPDLPTSECTPLSTTLNTPVHSDNEESSEQVEDLTISTNPIEVVQNSPIISFTHSPVRVEPYEHLNGQRGNGKSHVPLDFDFQEENQVAVDDLTAEKHALNAKDIEKGNSKSSKTYLPAAKQNTETMSVNAHTVQSTKSSTNVSTKSCKEGDSKKVTKTTNDKLENTSTVNIAASENIVFRVPDSQERLQPIALQDGSLYTSSELNDRDLIDTSEMIPLIPGEESEEPRMPVPPMEGNCLTKVIKNTLPITNLNVIESDDEKLDKNDDIWMEVGCMDKLMDCNINLENSENVSQEKYVDGSKFFKIRKKHFKHFKRDEHSHVSNRGSNDSIKNVRGHKVEHANKEPNESTRGTNQSSDSVQYLSPNSKIISKGNINRERNSKTTDKERSLNKIDGSKEPIKTLKEFRKISSKSSLIGQHSNEETDDHIENNTEASTERVVGIVEDEMISKDNSSPSFTKSFVRKNTNSDFEIQVTNVNFKIKDKDIRTELLTLKDKNQTTAKDSMDAIKIEINVSCADRNYGDKRQHQNSLEEGNLEISNNKISSTSAEYDMPVKNKQLKEDVLVIDKSDNFQNNSTTRNKGQEDTLTYEKSQDLKRKISSNYSIDYLPSTKKSKTENNALTSYTNSGQFLDYESNNICSTTKFNYPSDVPAKSKAETRDEPDSLSLVTHNYFGKNVKDDEFSILPDIPSKNSPVKYSDKESKKEHSLVISNEKFFLTEQKRASNSRDVEGDKILSVVDDKIMKSTKERKLSTSNQDASVIDEKKSQNTTTNSKTTEFKLTEDVDVSKKADSLNTPSDYIGTSEFGEILDIPLDVTLPIRRFSTDTNAQNSDEKPSTLSELSKDIKKLQEEFDSIEAAGKNFCMRDMKKLQEQFDSIEYAEKSFCSREMQKSQEHFECTEGTGKNFNEGQTLYSMDRTSDNSRREEPAILDFDNFDVAPNEANDSDDNHACKWKKPRLNFQLEDGDLYESSSGFINPIFTSLDELENLNTVPVYTTKDGKITYSPNKKYTYRVLIMEAREKERTSVSREPYFASSFSHDYYNSSKIRKFYKKRHGAVENSRRRHTDYNNSRTSHESTTKHYTDNSDYQRYRHGSKSRESNIDSYKNKNDPKCDVKNDEENRSSIDNDRRYPRNLKYFEEKPISNEKSKSSHVRQSRSKFDVDEAKEDASPAAGSCVAANRDTRNDEPPKSVRPSTPHCEKKEISEKSSNDRLSSYIQKFGAPCESIKKWNFEDVLGTYKPVDLSSGQNKHDVVISVKMADKPLSPEHSEESQVQEKCPLNESYLSTIEGTAGTVANNEKAGETRNGMEITTLQCTSKNTDLNMKSPLPDDTTKHSDGHSYGNDDNESQKGILKSSDEITKSGENVIQSDKNLRETIPLESTADQLEKTIRISDNDRSEPEIATIIGNDSNTVPVEKELNLLNDQSEDIKELEHDEKINTNSPITADVNSVSITEQHFKWTPEIDFMDDTVSKDIHKVNECKFTEDEPHTMKQSDVFSKETFVDRLQGSTDKNNVDDIKNSLNSNDNSDKHNDALADDINNTDNNVKINVNQTELFKDNNILQTVSANDEMNDEDLSLPQLERIDPEENYINESQGNPKLSLSEGIELKSLNDAESDYVDDAPPVLHEETPFLRKESKEVEKHEIEDSAVDKSSNENKTNEETKAVERLPSPIKEISKEINNEPELCPTSSNEFLTQVEDNKMSDSNSMEISEENDALSKSYSTVPQTIPKLIIKKTDSNVEGVSNKSSTKLKLSMHPKIPKMIIRNVRSRPGTPTVEEIPDVHSKSKAEQVVFKIDNKMHEKPCKSEHNQQQSKLCDNKILKVKIKLEENSSVKTLKSEDTEVWSSRKDSKKMVPKVTITKIKTSPKIQENSEHFSRKETSNKVDEAEDNRSQRFRSDSHESYESTKTSTDKKKEKVPKLKLRKHDSRSSSPDVGRRKHSSSFSEVTAKKCKRSGKEETKQTAKRSSSNNKETILSDSEKKYSACSVSEKIPKVIPKVIIKRTSASAEFKCELSKEGKDAIIKSARWQPAVKLHRSEVLDRLVKDLKNSRITLTQALLKVEEERYQFTKRLPKLSRSNSTSNLTPIKCKQRRMSDYDNKPSSTESSVIGSNSTTWYIKGGVQATYDNLKSTAKETITSSEELGTKCNVKSEIVENLKVPGLSENPIDRNVRSAFDAREHVPKRRNSYIERQEEFNEETQDAGEIVNALRESKSEPLQSSFTNASKIMCIIPRVDQVGLSRTAIFDSLKETPPQTTIKQEIEDAAESVNLFKDQTEGQSKNNSATNALSKDEVDCAFVKTERIVSTESANSMMENDDVPRKTKGIVSMESFEDTEASVIKVDSSDDSQSTIELLPASPDVSQTEMELHAYELNDNECQRLYSADAIPTQFELELEITDNSNVDPLDVPLPKDMHLYRDDSTKYIDEQDCLSDRKHSPTFYEDIPSAARCKQFIPDQETSRRRSSMDKDFYRSLDEKSRKVFSNKESSRNPSSSVASYKLRKQEEHNDECRFDTVSFYCSDSLVKEVMAAKETLKKCLARSCSESSAISQTKPKTAVERKQGTSFSADNPTDRYDEFTEYTKSEADSKSSKRTENAAEDLRITTTNTQRKTDTESNTEKSDRRHSKQYACSTTGRTLKMKLPASVERRTSSEDVAADSRESPITAEGTTTISLKNSKRLGQLVFENDAASSWLECEQSRKVCDISDRDDSVSRSISGPDYDKRSPARNAANELVQSASKEPRRSRTSSRGHLSGEESSKTKEDNMPVLEPETDVNFDLNLERDSSRSPPVITNQEVVDAAFQDSKDDDKISSDNKASMDNKCDKECEEMSVADIVTQLAFNEKATINHRRYCILCERWFPTTARHRRHLTGYQHRHTELVQRRTIHALFMLFTGRPCPRLLTGNAARTDCSPGEPTPLQIAVQDVATRVEQVQRDSRKQNNVNK